MSRALFITSLLRSFRAISSFKTGSTLGSTFEVVKPPLDNMDDVETKKATFSMSCFWFPEAQFGCANGVVRTKVGYTGGSKPFPTYYSLGNHTETIQLEYDPNLTTYSDLLTMFWKNHDSTTSHKPQYMSAIFYHDEDQKQLAEKTRDQYQKTLRRPIVTKILPAKRFYDAEDYHQKYLLRQQPTLLKSLGLNSVEVMNSFVATRLNGYVGGYGSVKDFEAEVDDLKVTEAQADMVRKIIGNKSRF